MSPVVEASAAPSAVCHKPAAPQSFLPNVFTIRLHTPNKHSKVVKQLRKVHFPRARQFYNFVPPVCFSTKLLFHQAASRDPLEAIAAQAKVQTTIQSISTPRFEDGESCCSRCLWWYWSGTKVENFSYLTIWLTNSAIVVAMQDFHSHRRPCPFRCGQHTGSGS